MKTLHLFAGIGGGLLCDLILGHEPIAAVEWDKYACAVLRQRAKDGWFPNLQVHEGDVRLFNPSEYAGRVDCIHAGFPCTDLSGAGKQAGLGEGTRSGLYREVLRIAGVLRPKYIFLENVSAILSLRQKLTLICFEKIQQFDFFGKEDNQSFAGRYIRHIIEAKHQAAIGYVLGDLASMGYDAKWCCIKASDVGANHHRDRWWCLCTRRESVSSHAEHDWIRRREQFSEGVEEKNCATICDTNNMREPTCAKHDETCRMQSNDAAESKYAERNVSNSDSVGYIYSESKINTAKAELNALGKFSSSCSDVPDTNGAQQQGEQQPIRSITEHSNISKPGWWEIEPNICRVDDGVAFRVDRLKAIGNGQVPLQAAIAFRILKDR